MSDYTPHIDTEAVNLELMERYLEGSLSEKERKEMEENLANDPILADAMEGLAMIEDKEAMKVALGRITEGSKTKLNKYIKKRDQLSKRRSRVEHNNFRFTNYYVAAAAAVAVIISTVWVIRMSEPSQDSSSFAEANTTEESQIQAPQNPDVLVAPPLSDQEEDEEKALENEQTLAFNADKNQQFSAPIEQTPASSILRDGNTDRKTIPPSADDFILENPVALTNKDSEEDDLDTSEIAEEKISTDEISRKEENLETIAAKSINKVEAQGTENKLKTELKPQVLSKEELSRIPLDGKKDAFVESEAFNEGREQKSRTASRKKRLDDNRPDYPEQSEEDRVFGKISKGQHLADLMLEAIQLYESAQFDKSLVYLKEVMQSSPDHPAANYYTGSIYRNFSQMKTATDYLKEAIKHVDAPTYEYAQWELALVYLARRKSSAAKKLLMKIATAGGKFTNQARSELKKLEE